MDGGLRSLLPRLALAGAATLLAGAVGGYVWQAWYYSGADSYEESVADHISSYASLRPGGTFRVAAFPASERQAEVPTYTVEVSSRFLREREFPDAPAPGVRRIFAVGDSATFGTGVAPEERFTGVLQARLEAADPGCCEVLNAGWVGATTAQVLHTVRERVMQLRPTVVVVNGGANDLRVPGHPMALDTSPEVTERFARDLREIVRLARARGVEVVLWANANADRRAPTLRPLRDAMAAVAEAEGVPWVDLEAVLDAAPATEEEQRWFLDHGPWTSFNGIPLGPQGIPLPRAALQVDWLHPNAFGHQRLADALLPHVRAALERAGPPPAPDRPYPPGPPGGGGPGPRGDGPGGGAGPSGGPGPGEGPRGGPPPGVTH